MKPLIIKLLAKFLHVRMMNFGRFISSKELVAVFFNRRVEGGGA
jgi:hypothetical protein